MEKGIKGYEVLFQPITIGKLEIKNRIVMAPLCTHQATPGGYVNNQIKAWFAARAKGGTGLIVSSPAMNNAKLAETSSHLNLRLYDHSHRKGMSELAEVVHAFGAKIFIITGPGHGRDTGNRSPSPSAVPMEFHPELLPSRAVAEHKKRGLIYGFAEYLKSVSGVVPRVITIDEIVELEDSMANMVLMARQVGLDGVLFNFGHGHLGHQFFSPRMNKRHDVYGGSLENRARLLMNTLNKTRAKVGRDFCVGIRISGEEHMPGGLSPDDVRRICQLAEPLIDYILLTDGCYEASKYTFPDEDGTMLKYAEGLKQVLKIPVITPSIHAPEMAARAVADGKTDMVALGRALIADPEWSNKIAEGKRPVKCIRCNIGCLRFYWEGTPVRCMVNPEAGLEEYIPEYHLSRPFKKHWYHW